MTTEVIEQVPLRDGRVLEVLRAEELRRDAVLFHHGTPFSAVTYPAVAHAVAARGLSLLYCSTACV